MISPKQPNRCSTRAPRFGDYNECMATRAAPAPVPRVVDRFFDFSLLGMLAAGYFAVVGSGYLDWPTATLTLVGLCLRGLMVAGVVEFEFSNRLVAGDHAGLHPFLPSRLFLRLEFVSHRDGPPGVLPGGAEGSDRENQSRLHLRQNDRGAGVDGRRGAVRQPELLRIILRCFCCWRSQRFRAVKFADPRNCAPRCGPRRTCERSRAGWRALRVSVQRHPHHDRGDVLRAAAHRAGRARTLRAAALSSAGIFERHHARPDRRDQEEQRRGDARAGLSGKRRPAGGALARRRARPF